MTMDTASGRLELRRENGRVLLTRVLLILTPSATTGDVRYCAAVGVHRLVHGVVASPVGSNTLE